MSNLLLKEEWPVESDQVVLGFIELTLENIQGHRLYNLPGQPTPPSDALVVKVSPSIQTYSYAQVHKAQNTFGHLDPSEVLLSSVLTILSVRYYLKPWL